MAVLYHVSLECYIEDITWPRALRVLKKYFPTERSERGKYFSTLDTHNFLFIQEPNGNGLLVYYINTNYINRVYFGKGAAAKARNHNNGDIFTCKDMKFSRERFPGISLVLI